MLLLAPVPFETGKTGIPKSLLCEMGRDSPAGKEGRDDHIPRRESVRSTGHMSSYERPLHIVSAQVFELGITFAQKSVDGKSNEIPAVPELIEEIEISGCIVVADVLNYHKKTARAVIDGRVDHLLCAKDN